MSYLNNAGTSWPKPQRVHDAVERASRARPERWGAIYDEAHATTTAFFGVPDPARFLFTSGCTAALSLALESLPWSAGDRLITSGLEHHALARPVEVLARERGVIVERAPYAPGAPVDLDWVEGQLEAGGVRLLAMTMASNVTGELLPYRELVALAHAHGALCLLDGAQVAGVAPLDLGALGVDIFAFAGHKGTLGPQGVGGLYVASNVTLLSPEATCSIDPTAPRACAPALGFCDVGSVNLAGVAGLSAGLDWLSARERSTLEATRPLLERLLLDLHATPGVSVLGAQGAEARLPIVALTFEDHSVESVAAFLSARGIHARAGLHCAPMAHETLGAQGGTLRMSLGPMHRMGAIEAVIEALRSLK